MSSPELLHAYRRLMRAGLRAVQFSSPSRYAIRGHLRDAFRDKQGTFDPEGIRRTIWFLNAAAQERGLEHKILKNIVRVFCSRNQTIMHFPWRQHLTLGRVFEAGLQKHGPRYDTLKDNELEHYKRTIAMLNETMGICLR
ncbi:hypothetical protein B0T22DRAFT_520113 [Podospora appendiculata]|uniref:DUF1763-domain-containing protein n=1 Tax=Podospora appendiculata TaxID=314037 RepID=A0AAE1C975_9PEZI|nr:hypothetical protein B0T22DRAFT_520113 [Podospora appendiculata]